MSILLSRCSVIGLHLLLLAFYPYKQHISDRFLSDVQIAQLMLSTASDIPVKIISAGHQYIA